MARTFTLQQLSHVGGEDCAKEVCESSLPIRLKGLQQVTHRQREHDPIHSMGDTLRNHDILLLIHNRSSVDGCDLEGELNELSTLLQRVNHKQPT